MRHTMVFITAALFAGFLPVANGASFAYLRQLSAQHDLLTIANSSFFRNDFKIINNIPKFVEYLQKEGVTDLNTLTKEVHSEKAIAWLNEYYPRLTEEQMLSELEKDGNLRARIATFIISLSFFIQQGNSTLDVYKFSLGHSLFWEALDEDTSLEAMVAKINQASVNIFVSDIINFRSDNSQIAKVRPLINYSDIGGYLMRHNHLNNQPLSPNLVNFFRDNCCFTHEQIELMTQDAARQLQNQGVSAYEDDGNVLGMDMALLVDLLTEALVIGNFIPSVYQLSDYAISYAFAEEIGINWDEDGEKVIDMLNRDYNPASAFQIAQLSRIGFSLEEIEQLTYGARDAVIVNNADRDEFVSSHASDDWQAINELVAEKGSLVFLLKRYYHELDGINPHQAMNAVEAHEKTQNVAIWNQFLNSVFGANSEQGITDEETDETMDGEDN